MLSPFTVNTLALRVGDGDDCAQVLSTAPGGVALYLHGSFEQMRAFVLEVQASISRAEYNEERRQRAQAAQALDEQAGEIPW